MSLFRKTDSVEWPCTAKIPKGNGTKVIESVPFKIKFRILSNDEIKELPQHLDKEKASVDEVKDFIRLRTEAALNAMVGWDFTDMDFAKSEDVLAVTNDPYYRAAIIEGFWQAQNGKAS